MPRSSSWGLAVWLAPLAADAAPRRGGEMVFAQEAQVSGLDMHFSSAISSCNIAMHMYECRPAQLMLPSPSWPRSGGQPDGLTYTFPLRKGVLFHNGKEMTSADVLASFQRYQRHRAATRSILDPVVDRMADARTRSTRSVLELKEPRAEPFLEAAVVVHACRSSSCPAEETPNAPAASS